MCTPETPSGLPAKPSLWTPTPSSFLRIGLDLEAWSPDPASHNPIDPSRAEASSSPIPVAVRTQAPAPQTAWATPVLLSAELFTESHIRTLDTRVDALLADLAKRGFLLAATRTKDHDLTSALDRLGAAHGCELHLSAPVQALLTGSCLCLCALVTCLPRAHLSLVRVIERHALFRAETCGRIANPPQPSAPPKAHTGSQESCGAPAAS